MQDTPTRPSSEDAATAEDLAIAARLYHECATAADEKFFGMFGPELSALYPVLDGLCHSVELALKSYLKRRGVGFHERNHHSIKRLYDLRHRQADASGDAFPTFDPDLIDVVDDLNYNKVVRYGERGRWPRRPVYTHLDEMAESLLDYIDAPAMSQLRMTK